MTLEMDLENSTSVSLSVYRALDGTESPDNSELIGKSTVISSTRTNSGKISFKFKGVDSPSGWYYYIIEPEGGDISMKLHSASWWDFLGEVWVFESSSWTRNNSYDYSFGIAGDC